MVVVLPYLESDYLKNGSVITSKQSLLTVLATHHHRPVVLHGVLEGLPLRGHGAMISIDTKQ
jgi:hypothetical protein